MDLLTMIVFYGLSAAGLGLFLRALPWPRALLDYRLPLLGTRLGDKPLACPVCMPGWGAIIVLAPDVFAGSLPLREACFFFCACIAIGAPLFHFVYPPPVDVSDLDDLVVPRPDDPA